MQAGSKLTTTVRYNAATALKAAFKAAYEDVFHNGVVKAKKAVKLLEGGASTFCLKPPQCCQAQCHSVCLPHLVDVMHAAG